MSDWRITCNKVQILQAKLRILIAAASSLEDQQNRLNERDKSELVHTDLNALSFVRNLQFHM